MISSDTIDHLQQATDNMQQATFYECVFQ